MEREIIGLKLRMDRVELMEARVAEIHEIVTRGKGGVQVLVAIGTTVTSIAIVLGALVAFVRWITGK